MGKPKGLAVATEETGPGAVFICREERHEEVVDAARDRILDGHLAGKGQTHYSLEDKARALAEYRLTGSY